MLALAKLFIVWCDLTAREKWVLAPLRHFRPTSGLSGADTW